MYIVDLNTVYTVGTHQAEFSAKSNATYIFTFLSLNYQRV